MLTGIGAILIVAGLIALYGRNYKKQKNNKEKEPYNGFHLGEMTGHDVTRNFQGDKI